MKQCQVCEKPVHVHFGHPEKIQQAIEQYGNGYSFTIYQMDDVNEGYYCPMHSYECANCGLLVGPEPQSGLQCCQDPDLGKAAWTFTPLNELAKGNVKGKSSKPTDINEKMLDVYAKVVDTLGDPPVDCADCGKLVYVHYEDTYGMTKLQQAGITPVCYQYDDYEDAKAYCSNCAGVCTVCMHATSINKGSCPACESLLAHPGWTGQTTIQLMKGEVGTFFTDAPTQTIDLIDILKKVEEPTMTQTQWVHNKATNIYHWNITQEHQTIVFLIVDPKSWGDEKYLERLNRFAFSFNHNETIKANVAFVYANHIYPYQKGLWSLPFNPEALGLNTMERIQPQRLSNWAKTMGFRCHAIFADAGHEYV